MSWMNWDAFFWGALIVACLTNAWSVVLGYQNRKRFLANRELLEETEQQFAAILDEFTGHKKYNLDVVEGDRVSITCGSCGLQLGITFISGWGAIAEKHYLEVTPSGGE